jgi:hypothetical protein
MRWGHADRRGGAVTKDGGRRFAFPPYACCGDRIVGGSRRPDVTEQLERPRCFPDQEEASK